MICHFGWHYQTDVCKITLSMIINYHLWRTVQYHSIVDLKIIEREDTNGCPSFSPFYTNYFKKIARTKYAVNFCCWTTLENAQSYKCQHMSTISKNPSSKLHRNCKKWSSTKKYHVLKIGENSLTLFPWWKLVIWANCDCNPVNLLL